MKVVRGYVGDHQLDPEAGYLSESATVREIGYGRNKDPRKNTTAFRNMRYRNADAVFEGYQVFPNVKIGIYRVYSREDRERLVRWLDWHIQNENAGPSHWKQREAAT